MLPASRDSNRSTKSFIDHRRCTITQEKTLPPLEAAHIRPYADGGVHEARNGLLLRRDIQTANLRTVRSVPGIRCARKGTSTVP
ncbi:MAG: HNH endonuclease [Gemmobacter sp.]